MNLYKSIGCSQEDHLPNCGHFGQSESYLGRHAFDCPYKKYKPCDCNPNARSISGKPNRKLED